MELQAIGDQDHADQDQEGQRKHAQGRMAVVSSAVTIGRLTEERAAGRNHLVAQLASQIVVAHASAGGRLALLCDGWSAAGRSIRRLTAGIFTA